MHHRNIRSLSTGAVAAAGRTTMSVLVIAKLKADKAAFERLVAQLGRVGQLVAQLDD